MRFSQVSLVAFATGAVAWTKATPNQMGLLRRADSPIAYEPEKSECGEGATCAEACGSGYELCAANDGSDGFCYNPGKGETCCEFTGHGRSCSDGFLCAHDGDKNTVCCANGSSLEDCAKENSIAGGLTADPKVESTTTSSSTTTTATSSSSGEATTSTEEKATTTSAAAEEASSSDAAEEAGQEAVTEEVTSASASASVVSYDVGSSNSTVHMPTGTGTGSGPLVPTNTFDPTSDGISATEPLSALFLVLGVFALL